MSKPELKAEAIRCRLEERLSLEDISERLGVSQSGCSYWLRDYPLSKEEIAERNRRPRPVSPAPPPFLNPCTRNTDGKGTIALMHFLLRASEKGVGTSLPTQPARYDVVVDDASGLHRVQVKYAGQVKNGGFSVSVASLGHSKKKKRYTTEQIDYIAAYAPVTGKVYLLPASVWEGKLVVYLRYSATRNNQKSGCIEAAEYEY